MTLDCLKAAPTMTILVSGIIRHLKIAYTASRKDLPNPRLAVYMGKDRFQSSLSMAVWTGNKSMFKSFFTVH